MTKKSQDGISTPPSGQLLNQLEEGKRRDLNAEVEVSLKNEAISRPSDDVIEENTSLITEDKIQKCMKLIKLKDSGYCWVVLVAMVLSNVLTAGYVKSFGMTYNIILLQYPNTSGLMSGVIMGLLAGCRCMFAPVAGAFNSAFGIRNCMIFGTILCFLGQVSSFFCSSVLQLSITLGAMMGMGLCFIESCQVVIINFYFDTHLALANGFRVCGNPLGGIFFPFILTLFLQWFGSRLMNLVIGGLFLNIFVVIAIIRPIETHKRIQTLNAIRKVYGNEGDSNTHNSNHKRKTYEALIKLLPNDGQTKKKKNIEFHYLKNFVYWIFLAMAMFIPLAIPVVIYYIPIYALTIGLTPVQNSALLAFQNIVDLVFRIMLGFLSGRNICKKINGFIACLILGGIGVMIIPSCNDILGLIGSITIFSVGSAGYFVFLNVILSEQFGKSSIATTWGFVRVVQGSFCFINPPILGVLIDYTGSYAIPFVVMGLGMITAAFLLCLEPLIIRATGSNVILT